MGKDDVTAHNRLAMRIWTHPRFLKWLPAVALLAGWICFPKLRTGDHREGTWADPHTACFMLALLYLIVMFGVGLKSWAADVDQRLEIERQGRLQEKGRTEGDTTL